MGKHLTVKQKDKEMENRREMRKQRTSQEDTTSDLWKFQKSSTGSSVERNDQRYNT